MALVASLSVSQAQSILREFWLGLPGSTVSDLTSAPAFPNAPSGRTFPTLFEAPSSFDENYGTRMRGYVKAPTTGNYRFWIAGDDNCELWLSTDENPGSRRLVARVLTWTNSRVWEEPRDGNNLAQKSAAIPLVAGRKYYIEALHKEGGGGDCLAVGWQLPSGVLERPIPGSRLEAFQLSQDPPTIRTQPADATVYEGQEARFSVAAVGLEPLAFQWMRDGVPLPIEQSGTLILTAPRLQDSGSSFSCVITNPKGATNTRSAALIVRAEVTPPALATVAPVPGATVRMLSQLEVTFTEPVSGVDAADLLINGVAATNVTGAAAGPYLFQFQPAVPGAAAIQFAEGAGIKDLSENENAFPGGNWTCTVDPGLPLPKIRVSEINAANETGLRDEDGEAVDWIELENFGVTEVNINGWSLTDSRSEPGKWIFPDVTIGASQRLVVFASGKDRRVAGKSLHTNFLLSGAGEHLGLFDGGSPRSGVSVWDEFPEQRVNYSYGHDGTGALKYFAVPTPGAANGASTLLGILPPPHFSNERGFYNGAFQVFLTTDVPGAEIYFTTNGGDPSGAAGRLYTNAINIASTTILRASVLKTNYLPSAPVTHTYLYNVTAARRSLATLSVVTPTNNLTGPSGIIGIGGGAYGGDGIWVPTKAGDYHNPSKHGLAWERPTSIEYFHPTNDAQFQIDCGIRVQGSDYLRPRYTPSSKFSYRFYFRGDYGKGSLEFPLFDGAVTSFDQLVMRAGHNDDTNPFVKDELMRRLMIDCGQVGSHGIFHTVYLNGVYKGYYNLVERIEKHFMQDWHGSSAEWDVLEQNLIALDGDSLDFSSMLNFIRSNPMTNSANYLQASRRLDLTNYVDYLLVNIYGANGDWPGNNWRAARERSARGIWRFYLWDAEFAFGTYGQAVTHDTFAAQLSEGSEIPTIYQNLKRSSEFALFWADRVQKHFYNGGALSDSNVTRQFAALRRQLTNIIPGFDNSILNSWIPNRRKTVTNLFRTYGLAGAPGAPAFNQFGGRAPTGFQLAMTTSATGPAVSIYYTTNNADPRVMFSGAVSPTAQKYTAPVALRDTTIIKARMLNGTNWSALTEATFEVSQFGPPLRFTEVMYNPPGGDAYEFLELKNFSSAPVDLGGMSLDGVSFLFPARTVLPANGTIVLASSASPAAFSARYPGVTVFGHFGNSLANGGERIDLKDALGNIVAWVDFDDDAGWPVDADGRGYSLELASSEFDPNNPVSWGRSSNIYGSPGVHHPPASGGAVILSEVMPADGVSPGWIELSNPTLDEVNLAHFSVGTKASPRLYVFPAGASIDPGGRLVREGFPIALSGGEVFLFDGNTNRVDAMAYGRHLAGHSLARVNGLWTLGVPTPGLPNTAADLAPSAAVTVNEWMANPAPGADDWLELHNGGSAPAALQGMTLSVSNAAFRIPTLSFIPAGGYVQLFAAARAGPDQLSFKLPAAGGTVRLYDSTGVLVNTVAYAAQAEGVSEGRIQDGGATIARFAGSASPMAANYLVNPSSTLVINELMARNVRKVINPWEGASDWIELRNTGEPISLDGLSLSRDASSSDPWFFPLGITLGAGAHLTIWFDPTQPPTKIAAAPLNFGKSLTAEGGSVHLLNAAGQAIDQVAYGTQPRDVSIGRAGAAWTLLAAPTPGEANSSAAELGSATALRINEWSSETESSRAWVELHNPGAVSVALGTMSLTDELSLRGQRKFSFPPLSFIGPGGFAVWKAGSGNSLAPGEINFNVSRYGESLRLYSGSLAIADTVSFGLAPTPDSLGRWPDGAGNPVVSAPSPGSPNFRTLAGIRINEVAPAENMVELRNLTFEAIDLSGWGLSNDPAAPMKSVFPKGATIPAQGYLAVALPAGALMDASFGGTVTLSRAMADGPATGEQARFDYGPAENGLAYGPLLTSLGMQSVALESLTPGNANSAVLPGPIVMTELMHRPATSEAFEYIEILNTGNNSVPLGGWRVSGGVQFSFPPGALLPPRATAIVAHFDPAQDPAAQAEFERHYHLEPGTLFLGPLRGKLANEGDRVALERPLPVAADGFRPFVSVDHLAYSDRAPWPPAPDGTASLHRIRTSHFGNEPLNWIAAPPSPGRNLEVWAEYDRDADGVPDVWEIAHGLDPFDAADAVTDPDGDGLSNDIEFQLGSDPTDPASGFVLHVSWTESGPVLRFHAAANIVYRIEARASLAEGVWEPMQTQGPFAAATAVAIPLLGDGLAQRYYRVVK